MAIPDYTLKTFQFHPTTQLIFADYKPIKYDQKGRLEAYKAQDVLEEKASAKDIGYSGSVREFRDTLHPSEWKAFDDKVKLTQDEAAYEYSRGNFDIAENILQNGVHDLLNNRELQNKQNAYASFLKEQQAIKNGNYSNYTKRRWDAVNQYYDDGTGTWTAKNFIPTKDIPITDILNAVVGATPTRHETVSNQSTTNSHTFYDSKGNIITDENGNPITDPTDIRVRQVNGVPYKPEYFNQEQVGLNTKVSGQFSSTSTSGQRTDAYTAKRAEDIMNVFKDMLKDENISGSIKQQYDNMRWLYDEANSILNNPDATEEQKRQARTDLEIATEALTDADGFVHYEENGYKNWALKQAEQYAKDAQYRHTTLSTTSSEITSYDGLLNAKQANTNSVAADKKYNNYGNAQTQSTSIVRNIMKVFGGGYKAEDDAVNF